MSTAQLKKRITELRQKIAALRMERLSKPAKNVRSGRNLRKTLAIVQTVLGEKLRMEKKPAAKGAKSV